MWAGLLAEVCVVVRVVVGVDGADYLRVRGCGWAYWPSSGLFWWSLVDDFCVFKGVAAPAGRRLGRLGRLVACWWTTFVVLGWAFGCSRLWAGVLAVV